MPLSSANLQKYFIQTKFSAIFLIIIRKILFKITNYKHIHILYFLSRILKFSLKK